MTNNTRIYNRFTGYSTEDCRSNCIFRALALSLGKICSRWLVLSSTIWVMACSSVRLQSALEKLKKDVYDRRTVHFGSSSCGKIYDIKRLAMTKYFFYYNNHILYQGFSNLRDFFRPYIESIICSNSDAAAVPSHWGDMEIANQKYHISCIDYDIITKSISTKDLGTFITTYNVKRLNTNTHEIEFLVECFKNICHSVVAAEIYGYRQSSLITLSNIISLLNLVTLSDNDKIILEKSITELFSNEVIIQILFSTCWPDFRFTLQALSQLCKSLALVSNFEIVRRIITSENFFDYAANVNFSSLRQLVVAFLPGDDKCVSSEIQNIIDKVDHFQKKLYYCGYYISI